MFFGVLRTTNGRRSWGYEPTGVNHWFEDVCFVDAEKGWIVGDGAILATRDGGATWETCTPGADGFFFGFGVSFVDAGTGWVASAIVQGGNWEAAEGAILKTTDGGLTWTEQTSGILNLPYSGVSFVNANMGWTVGRTTILATADGGTTWEPQSTGTPVDLVSVFFVDANRGWIVGYAGNNGTIFATADGGATWVPQTSGTTTTLRRVSFVDASTGWIVGSMGWGDAGTILASKDGGETWTLQTTETHRALFDIVFVDANTGWVVGEGGTILKTTTGGESR